MIRSAPFFARVGALISLERPDPGQSHARQLPRRIVEPLAGVFYNNHQGHQIKQEVVDRLGGCS